MSIGELASTYATLILSDDGIPVTGGDFFKCDGSYGESIYGGKFPDESSKMKHDAAGLLTMAIADHDSRGSLFNVTLGANRHLDGKYVIFGKLVQGGDVLKKIENAGDEDGDRVLAMANLAFEGTPTSVKLSGIHWWYKTTSHAAELTAGFSNRTNRDGYSPIASMLKKHDTALNFICVELCTVDQQEGFPEAMADPEGLVWQVLNAAWDADILVASENAVPCYGRQGYNKIFELSKPRNDPDGRHLSAFTYLRLNQALLEEHNLGEFHLFVKRMHGVI